MSKGSGATPEGTKRYADRFTSITARGHFQPRHDLWMSTIGLGTYLGHWDEATDRMYIEAIKRAVDLGCNVIDSAINYRFQRSERAIGAALRQLFDSGKAARDEVVIATKAGFFAFEEEPPRNARAWLMETIINPGYARVEDIIDSHCMAPGYLARQLECSLKNLGLEKIDIYYVHNPETQLEALSRGEFLKRIRAAFEFLESAVADGRIGMYGTATWNGYRQPPNSRGHLALAEMLAAARDVGGADHHFGVIQLPYNLAMPEALTSPNQEIDGQQLSALEAAASVGLTVMCSASLMQASLTQNLPDSVEAALTGLSTAAQRAIQFVRSTPGVATALIGMCQRSHVEENLAVARVAPAPVEDFFKMFSSAGD